MSNVVTAGIGWNTMGAQWRQPVLGGMRPSPAPTQPWPNLGRFRRHLSGLTTDAVNAPLGGVSVEWFSVATDLSVGATVSDAGGNYDIPMYVDGLFQAMIWKAGPPNVFGSSDRIAPV